MFFLFVDSFEELTALTFQPFRVKKKKKGQHFRD